MFLRQIAARYPHLRQGKKRRHLVRRRTASHELDQGQRETLYVGQLAERHVKDAQDRRKVGLVRHLFIRQWKSLSLKIEEAEVNLFRGARGMEFVIQPDALVGWAQVPEA